MPTPYSRIVVFAPLTGGTQIGVAESGTLIIPASVFADDPAQSGDNQTFARVIGTAPTGAENGVVVREAQMGVAGTGISPPTGGGGILGWLSGIYNLLLSGLSIAIGGTNNKAVVQGHSSDTPIKGAPGVLNSVLVTSLVEGAPAVIFTDGSGGNVIEIIPAGAPLGYRRQCVAVATTSIVMVGNAENPGVTAFYT